MAAKPKELRGYQEAILRAMEDGLPHHRDELTRIGVAAVDPHYALSMYQQKHKAKAESRFAGMTNEQRFAEIERQRYEGAKLQVSKFLSHMETRLLAEVVEFAPPAAGKLREKRISFRITDRGRARLAGASEEQINENWTQEAREALIKVARRQPTFISEDVWSAPLPQPETDPGQRPLDPIFQWAERHHYITLSETPSETQRYRIWESLIYGTDELPTVHCMTCGKITDPTEIGSSIEALGFIEIVNDVGTFATNKILDVQPTGQHRCADCTEKKKRHRNRVRRQRD